MKVVSRRQFLGTAAYCVLGTAGGWLAANRQTAYAATKETSKEEWMKEWMTASKAPQGALHLQRFADPTYFLTKPIRWFPNPDQEKDYEPVDVPVGFVTDFASIPRPFWSLLRPDGLYTYPAIVHDYLYWTQDRPKDIADDIFKFGMQDFDVNPAIIAVIYKAVQLAGIFAWRQNSKLKQQGEKRILKRFPDDALARWEDWKKRPCVF